MCTLPPNSLIIVTGITGYIASHVGLEGLRAGFRVRGTVRSREKAQSLRDAYMKTGIDASENRLDFVLLDDLRSKEQLRNAFVDADGIAHIALPDYSPPFLQDVADSTRLVLRVARDVSVKYVVLCSTFGTARQQGTNDRVINDLFWNEAEIPRYKNASDEQKRHAMWFWTVHSAAKVLSERAAWKWVQEEKHTFLFSCILPSATFGPVIYGEPRSTGAWIPNLLKGDNSLAADVPPTWSSDVRDVARLHILAFKDASFAGKRVISAASPFGWNQLKEILREHFPNSPVPDDVAGSQGEPSKERVDSEFARKALGGHWIPLVDAVVDSCKAAAF